MLLPHHFYESCSSMVNSLPFEQFPSKYAQFLSDTTLKLSSFPLHPLEASYCSMIPFVSSILRLLNSLIPPSTTSILSTDSIPWLRSQFGSPWAITNRPLSYIPSLITYCPHNIPSDCLNFPKLTISFQCTYDLKLYIEVTISLTTASQDDISFTSRSSHSSRNTSFSSTTSISSRLCNQNEDVE